MASVTVTLISIFCTLSRKGRYDSFLIGKAAKVTSN